MSWRLVSNGSKCMEQPYLSIVIPVYNEESNLVPLMERLYPVVDGTGRPFEVIFTNDGSRDRSLEILQRMVQQYPGVKVVEFNGNFGQHMAILAAFEVSSGEIVVTLRGKLEMDRVGLGDDNHTASISIEAMDNSRSRRASTIAQLLKVKC